MTRRTDGLTPIGAVLGCRHGPHHFARRIIRTGENRVVVWCPDCRRNVTRAVGYSGDAVPHDDLRLRAALQGLGIDTLPVVETWMLVGQCEGPCGRWTQREEHHTAPSVIFGDEAPDWPTVYLCRECHLRWHHAVTWYIPTFFRLPIAVHTLGAVASLEQVKTMFRRIVNALQGDREGAA